MKILLIRTIRVELLPGVIQKLKTKHGWDHITVLSHRSVFDARDLANLVDEMVYYGSKADFGIFTASFSLIRRLRTQKFDCIVYPHYHHPKYGYRNVIHLAFILGAAEIYAADLEGELTGLSWIDVIVNACRFCGAVFLTVLVGSMLLLYSGARCLLGKIANKIYPDNIAAS